MARLANGSAPFRMASSPKLVGMRYPAIDALRGFAALWVALYHLYGAADSTGSLMIVQSGHLGVYIFFVLSGFVIAKNLSGSVDARTVTEFALRRSVRLDPTYWTIIGASLLADAAVGRTYSPTSVLGNMFYLDNLLGLTSIVKVGWTLCYEVQFYFLYALIAWACSAESSRARNLRRVIPFALLLAASLLLPINPAWCLHAWYAFFLGVTVWWAVAEEVSWRLPVAVSAVVLAFRADAEGVATASTGLLILGLALFHRLNALDTPVVQFLGRISYSLYLVHPLVARIVRRMNLQPLVGLAAGLAASLLAAYVLYRLVEAPTHRWARKIHLRGPHPAADPKISLTAERT